MTVLARLIREFKTPGAGVDLHHRGSTAHWHATLGLVLGALLSWWPAGALAASVAVASAYWLAKEWGDLRRGGGLWDGIEDAAAVMAGAGAGYLFPAALPAVLVCHAAGLIVMAAGAWRK